MNNIPSDFALPLLLAFAVVAVFYLRSVVDAFRGNGNEKAESTRPTPATTAPEKKAVVRKLPVRKKTAAGKKSVGSKKKAKARKRA